ncbi:hypothetical protein EDB81DRAFT_914827 [Dactylonectria macrodidyma]|uniref:Subtelomeric hrmA-associated cluster protein AFUB-079030/YDR124W-like helical bundle domain-containing protein n=1 Tax=Dactylonectria macrodidyma TaxID=307937 RepID=A0A9P9DHG7_9HYPO|nr:hypothetical protein EDB81DRAFT_914827 [Dactylonectria macrodidyma]
MLQPCSHKLASVDTARDWRTVDGIDSSQISTTQDVHCGQPPMVYSHSMNDSRHIDDALRLHCSISAKRYFVVVISDDGKILTFSGPKDSKLADDVVRQFFDVDKYQRVMESMDTGASPVVDDPFGLDGGFYKQQVGFSSNGMPDRRRISNHDDWDERQPRKRARARRLLHDEEDVPQIVSKKRRGIQIGIKKDVGDFYDLRLKSCQQSACKVLAKAWIKAVAPKKQSTHPYTGSDEKAPDWWPKPWAGFLSIFHTPYRPVWNMEYGMHLVWKLIPYKAWPWGPTKDKKVRHKEPDHLYKRERVYLLNHILRMVTEPNHKQHSDIQKLNLNVKKLEEITNEALSGFFADNENPANAKKRPYLNEIFMVARQEERFRNGEIDATTEVFVMAEDKNPEAYAKNKDEPTIKHENDDNLAAKLATTHNLMPPAPDHGSSTALHGTPFLSDLPVRGTHYTPSMIHEMTPEQHVLFDVSSMSGGGQTSVRHKAGNLALGMGVATSQDSRRRPSIFNPPPEYSGQPGTSLYPQPWQPGYTAPTTSTMYAFTQQQLNPSATTFVNPGVRMNQDQTYMGGSSDGDSRGYGSPQASMFYTRGAPPQTVTAPPG